MLISRLVKVGAHNYELTLQTKDAVTHSRLADDSKLLAELERVMSETSKYVHNEITSHEVRRADDYNR